MFPRKEQQVVWEYDAAGRLTKEGDKAYSYGWLDKVMEITQGGKVTNSYSYGMDGQIATANISGKQESFIWDGLALLKRDTTEYVNEPSVTGGNPILANGKGLFNDMLGTTLGKYNGKKFIDNQRTSFGSGSREGFFTGKPHIAGLGYAFLFRNYRAELGKWQTQDLLGYPDGWNNLAYVNNRLTDCIDWLGATTITVDSSNISVSSTGYPNSSTASISVSYSGNSYTVSPTPTGGHYLYQKTISLTFTITKADGTTTTKEYYRKWTRSSFSSTAPFVLDTISSKGTSMSESITAPKDGRIVSISMSGYLSLVVACYSSQESENTAFPYAGVYDFSKSTWAE